MVRSLEFNRTKTLEASMKLFWDCGYLATSLADQLEIMRIGRVSFYASFVPKRKHFMQYLKLFGDSTPEKLQEDAKALPLTDLPRVFLSLPYCSYHDSRQGMAACCSIPCWTARCGHWLNSRWTTTRVLLQLAEPARSHSQKPTFYSIRLSGRNRLRLSKLAEKPFTQFFTQKKD